MQGSLVINESRILQARQDLAGVDDDAARRAIAIAERAHAELCNANYGFLNGFQNGVSELMRRLGD